MLPVAVHERSGEERVVLARSSSRRARGADRRRRRSPARPLPSPAGFTAGLLRLLVHRRGHAALAGRSFRCRFAADLREERREAVVVVLAPLLERMMVALRALQPHAEEELRGVFELLLRLLHLAIPGDRRVLRDVAATRRGSSRTNWSYGLFVSRLSRIHRVEGEVAARVLGFAAFVAQQRAPLVGEVVGVVRAREQRSMSLSRLAGSVSARNWRVSSGVGRRPAMSMLTRRRNVASSHGADGGMPSAFSLAKTSSSMKLRGAGRFSTGAPSGTVARKTATCPGSGPSPRRRRAGRRA